MRTYSHLGIPTTNSHKGEILLEDIGLYTTDHNEDPFHIEWLRFLPNCKGPKILQESHHIAFFVDDPTRGNPGKEILIEPYNDEKGTLIAFIVHDGVPIELMQK